MENKESLLKRFRFYEGNLWAGILTILRYTGVCIHQNLLNSNDKVLLYSTRNYIQYPVINIMEKNMNKNMCMYN